MNLLKEFEEWLASQDKKAGSKLSAALAYKYARAIKTISDDMSEIRLLDKSFYLNTSIQELKRDIEIIKRSDYFISKNNRGHNMYSVALDHYLSFIEARSV